MQPASSSLCPAGVLLSLTHGMLSPLQREAQGDLGGWRQLSAVSQGDKATVCACPREAAQEDCLFSRDWEVDGGDVEKSCSSSRQGPPGPMLKSARRGGSRRILHKSPCTTSVGLQLK